MAREIVARSDEIPPGSKKVVTVRGREIVVFNVGGEFFAFLNKCPHEGAKLCHGVLVGLTESDDPGTYHFSRKGEMLRCPWHGWEFDIRTGQSWFDPQRTKMREFKVTVGVAPPQPDGVPAGQRLQPGPYVAETFPASEEGEVIMVDV